MMRRLLMLALACVSSTATAQLRPIWPTALVTVNTSGTASATLGVNIQTVLPTTNRDLELSFAPQASTALSQGVAQLFTDASGKESGPTTWSAGTSLSLLQTEAATLTQTTKRRKLQYDDPVYVAAGKLCQNLCKDATYAKTAVGVCVDMRNIAAADLYPDKFCPEGNQLVKDVTTANKLHDRAFIAGHLCAIEDKCVTVPPGSSFSCMEALKDGSPGNEPDVTMLCADGQQIGTVQASDPLLTYSSPYSRLIASIGGQVAGGSFSYYAADPNMNLTKQSATKIGGTAGASFTFVNAKRHLTFEVPFIYSSAWTAATATVHSCGPLGTIRGTGGVVPAQSCMDATFGAPAQANAIYSTLQFGYVDIRGGVDDKTSSGVAKSFFRFALGPSVRYSTSTSGDTLILGILEAPLYLNFASAPAGYRSSNFSGMIRLTPIIGLSHDMTGWNTYVQVALTVLADTTMFRRALDWR